MEKSVVTMDVLTSAETRHAKMQSANRSGPCSMRAYLRLWETKGIQAYRYKNLPRMADKAGPFGQQLTCCRCVIVLRTCPLKEETESYVGTKLNK